MPDIRVRLGKTLKVPEEMMTYNIADKLTL